MRPLSIDGRREGANGTSAALLMQSIGAYCSLSEQPLPLENWLLDTRDGSVHREEAPGAPSMTLLLCHGCRDAHQLPEITIEHALSAMERSMRGPAHQRAPGPDGATAHLLLPNRDVTFRTGPESPFVYALEPVEIILTGKEGEPLERGSGERVIVRARSGAAQATLDRFALNTRFFDARNNTFSVPREIFLSNYDRRVEQRTQVWRHAGELARHFRDLPAALRAPFAGQVRRTAVAAGFWSVWVTVFDAVTGDRALLATLFGSPRTAAVAAEGVLLHEAFPGTGGGWLV
jgi:hypothetical protein